MSWLKRLFGGKDDDLPARNQPPMEPAGPAGPPPGPTPEEEAALQRMIDAGFQARSAFLTRLGESDTLYLVAPLLNPTFMGGPRWPAMRQSWRILPRSASTLFASDGLSDPFDDDLTPLGYRLEVCVETAARFANDDEAKRSWEFDLVYQASQAVAGAGGIYDTIEHDGMIVTTVFRIPEAPERLRDAEDRVGVIIGFPTDDLPREMALPDGKALLLPVTPIFPSELAWIENEADGQAARRHLVSLLRQQPRAHFATADRDPVV